MFSSWTFCTLAAAPTTIDDENTCVRSELVHAWIENGPAVDGLTMPLSVTLTTWPPVIVAPVFSTQVTIVAPLVGQLPTSWPAVTSRTVPPVDRRGVGAGDVERDAAARDLRERCRGPCW